MLAHASADAEAAPAADRLGELRWTGNALRDLVDLLKMGDCVVLKVGIGLHPYARPSIVDSSPGTYRIVVVDISADPDLALEGEWPYYFVSGAGAERCSAEMNEIVMRFVEAQGSEYVLNSGGVRLGVSTR